MIGGGIGGLTAAIALRRKGFDARVYERAPALREVGAGIWMPPNAMQVFDRLGIAADVQAAGQPIVTAEVLDRDAGLLQRMDIANPIGRRLRNILLRSTPDAVVRRQMMDLYGLKY